MKNLIYLFFISLIIILSSCSTQKHVAAWGEGVQLVGGTNYSQPTSNNNQSEINQNNITKLDVTKSKKTKSETSLKAAILKAPAYSLAQLYLTNNNDQLSSPSDDCDKIITKKGDIINAKVSEVGVSEIKYKKCENIDGPIYAISKSDVLSIIYSDGSSENISEVSSNENDTKINVNDDQKPELEIFGLVGFLSGIIGLFIFGYILGSLAIIFSIISLVRISKNPQKYKGKGFAIAGLILGIADVALLTLLLLL